MAVTPSYHRCPKCHSLLTPIYNPGDGNIYVYCSTNCGFSRLLAILPTYTPQPNPTWK